MKKKILLSLVLLVIPTTILCMKRKLEITSSNEAQTVRACIHELKNMV